MEPEFVIDPERVAQLCERPHAPLDFSNDEDRAVYSTRVWKVLQELESVLLKMGFHSSRQTSVEEPDFYISDDVGTFRFLTFQILSYKMICKDLIVQIAKFLDDLEEAYTVFFSSDIDDSIELFLVIVTPKAAYGQFEKSDTAAAFGFDPHSPLIGPID